MRTTGIRVVSAMGAFCAAMGSAAASPPDWCKGATEKLTASERDLKDLPGNADAEDAVETIVAQSCFPDADYAQYNKNVDAALLEWSRRLEMTDADWVDAASYTQTLRVGHGRPSITRPEDKKAWTTLSPVDQFARIPDSGMGMSNSGSISDATYLVDALGDHLAMAGRLAYIQVCMRSENPVMWAMCQPDIDAFDRKKVAAELRSDTSHEAYDRMLVRFASYQASLALPKHADKVKKLRASDSGYEQMFKVAAAAWKDFGGVDAKLLQLMTEIDDARVTKSRKASAGCVDRTWAVWKSVVEKIPAKSFGALASEDASEKFWFLPRALGLIVATPNGYLASLAHNLCTGLEDKQDYLTRELGSAVKYLPGFRGPRNAAHSALRLQTITLDDRDARIEYPELNRPWIQTGGGSSGGGMGEIAKVTASGDTTKIEFARVKTKQQDCVRGHRTNRVTRITSDGSLEYEYICQAWKTVVIDEPPFAPQTVSSRYATGLKKKMFVTVIENVVVVAYPKNGARD